MVAKNMGLQETSKWIKFHSAVAMRAYKTTRRKVYRTFSTTLPEDQPLHLELFSDEKLEQHARDLAPKHRLAKGPGRDLLLQRLADNERMLLEAYATLTEAVRKKQRISPAAEWLLDNFHVIEEQIRIARRHLPPGYSRGLPHLRKPNSNLIGYPRVYDIAIEVIAHVDGRVDQENITKFVAAYQQVTKLSLGEFWAIPIMLRLALIENLRRVAYRVVVGLNDRETANYWADQLLTVAEKDPKNLILVAADMARSNPSISNSFVAEFARRLHGQGQTFHIPLSWIDQQLIEAGSSTQQTIQLESQQQAANQVSVGSSIGSLRFLSAMDWRGFVEANNAIDAELASDPSGIYPKMTFATRDQYRRTVESLARKAKRPEAEVAHLAISLARKNARDAYAGHVGYYLVDSGLQELKDAIQVGSKFSLSFLSVKKTRFCLFIAAIMAISTLITFEVLKSSRELNSHLFMMSAIGILVWLCASQVAVALVNWLSTILIKPSLLPRLDFSKGIPKDARTLVAVPTMLTSPGNVAALLEGLEVRYLANRDENLHYALLTDFADAKTATTANDGTLLQLAVDGIKALNARYATKSAPGESIDVFFLMHRAREFSPQQGVWMGHERKRGKLEALNSYLRNPSQSPFEIVIGHIAAFSPVKYVITLDTDTQLPRDAAHELAGTLAHPLNRPFYDAKLGRITRGYGILQPRVAVSLPSSRASWFVCFASGEAGTDPYTRAVSDVYQDLFLEGSFVGKGIYDVDAFTASLAGKFPDNLILSHDLIESSYARSGLVSDVLLYEDFPANFIDDAKRRSRWIRGDWQIMQWLLPKSPNAERKWLRNSLSMLSRWKIFDNLRRSLVPLSTLLLLISSWTMGINFVEPWLLTKAVLVMVFLPPLLTTLAGATRKPNELGIAAHFSGILNAIGKHLIQAFLTIVFLPFEVHLSVSAIGKSLWRLFITRKHLLEWRPASDTGGTAAGTGAFYKTMAFAPLLALGLAAFIWHRDGTFGIAGPFLLLWIASPALAQWLSRRFPDREIALETEQTNHLRRLSRKTWRFFETFVGPAENWLPPDNFQEYPAAVIAHRTSPTNIGLSLLANLSAYDFGYLSATELVERTTHTFSTLDKLERFRGHFYNWYDTQSLLPLSPTYVSSVDSGNLVGLILTLRQGLNEIASAKVISPKACSGLTDTLFCLIEAKADKKAKKATKDFDLLFEDLSVEPQSLQAALTLYERITKTLSTLSGQDDHSDGREDWVQILMEQSRAILVDSQSCLLPLLQLPERPASLSETSELAICLDRFSSTSTYMPTWLDVANLNRQISTLITEAQAAGTSDLEKSWYRKLHRAVIDASRMASEKISACEELTRQCEEFATVEYDFLYDHDRHLFSIGYNVGEHRRDTGFYDLLASEARLGSFIAIAQGAIPQEHWFRLGRLLTTWRGEATLLSWSGSMFEYLMPLLVMPTFKNTLLDKTYHTAVRRQIAYGKEHGIPWGVSESGYNTTDVNLNYQYKAFGVPGLGFKRGLADDLVLAPYASVMAVMVEPKEAARNMKRMHAEGFEGRYGFYEAVDYTPSRLSVGQSHAIVRSFMAHHLGMSFMSLAYHLLDRKMQGRFQTDPLFKATELLLHERVPKVANIYPHAPEVSDPHHNVADQAPALRVIDKADTHRPEIHLLSNGRYSMMITNSGGGYSRWKNLALTRWREDPTCDNWGTFCYLRDVDSNNVWSATHQPSLTKPSHYEAIFPQGKAEFRRRDEDLELHTEITISPEDDIEFRRYTITNLSTIRRTIEFTTYSEVVLAPQASDEAHQAFSNLFVQTEILPAKHAILCKRRPRSASEATPTMLHLMTVHGQMVGEISYETDRSRFLGRGGSVHDALALKSAQPDLSGQAGSVLDPIVAIRCRVTLEPEQTASVHVVTGVGEQRADALALVEKYSDRHLADRVFELSWTHRQVVLRQLNVTEADAQLYGRLASSIIYTSPLRRADPTILLKNRRGQSGLWGHGISGDLPIVILRISANEHSNLVRQMVQAHGYWRMMGISVDLVIWNEDESTYRQDLHDSIMEMISAGAYLHQVDKPGGIFVRRSDQMSEEDRNLLLTVARAIISDTNGTLFDQIERRRPRKKATESFIPSRVRIGEAPTRPILSATPAPDLLFANGIGGFSEDGREYVITTSSAQVTPAPWSNVLANPYFGSVVSESGSAYTWCENAHEYRLTPWANDALTDSTGEAIFIRDEETGDFWSPTPLPARADAPYITRHGFGYSVFETTVQDIASELTTFVAIDAPIKMNLLKIRNTSSQPRSLSVTGYCEWVLGELRAKSLMHVVSELDLSSNALFVRNPYHPEFGGRVGFFDVSESQRTFTADRTDFIGRNRRLAAPAAMFKAKLSGRCGAALDSCSAMQTLVELAPGEEKELVFVLGVARDVDDARTLLQRFKTPTLARNALNAVTEHWQRILGAVQIKTPDSSLNLLMNGWLIYQVLSSRVWGRSGYYQSGGAYGFRDQLQDTMTLIHSEPRLLREQLLRCAARQFREGDVQHWWHPPSGYGVRTHFSDDYLWMPLAASRYVLGTGDTGVLDKRINFIEGRHVNVDEEAYGDLPAKSDESASLYDHCTRAIKNALKFGRHGLPLIGCGDWNDGMNLIGEHGKGESVWLAFFLCNVLEEFAPVATLHNDPGFAVHCREQARILKENIEKTSWDGEWYRRAYFDNGDPVGSAENLECQIDSIPQSWAVLSAASDPERAKIAMDAVYRRLIDKENRIIKLFDPPFDKSPTNPGYIKGYVPGVRENGGQYTHAAIWSAMAFAKLGDQERAWELLDMINPIRHGDSASNIATYKVEPYVAAADVYAVAPHTGRGGWTWYTGSAAWLYRLILESLLGLKLNIDRLTFAPCIPADWTTFELSYRYRETFFDIIVTVVDDPNHQTTIEVDGVAQVGQSIHLIDDHLDHIVKVTTSRVIKKAPP